MSIVSFQSPLEFVGMDGFVDRRHAADLVALELTTRYEFPVAWVERLLESDRELLDHLLPHVAVELTCAKSHSKSLEV